MTATTTTTAMIFNNKNYDNIQIKSYKINNNGFITT